MAARARHSGSGAAAVVLVVCSCIFGSPTAAAAQATREFDWSKEGTVWAANTALGGVSAGIFALVRGEPFLPAFLKGAGGGTLVYAGKRIAVERAFGMGLLGRQVGSVGGSMVGNAVAGRTCFHRIALALGPVRLYSGSDGGNLEWAIDVPAAVVSIWGLTHGGRLDVAESLSSGAVVMSGYGGHALPGNIFHPCSDCADRREYVLAHEQIHLLQYDQSFLSWGSPLEDWVAARVPGLEGPLDHLEFNLPVLLTAGALGFSVWKEHDEQVWEREAMYLGRTR